MKTAWRPSRLGWELLIFAPEPRKAIPQQIELDRVVHVDADQFTRLVPKLVRQALSVRNGLVEVYRCHMETVPLPDGKNLVKFPAAQATRNNRCDKPGEFFMSMFPHSAWSASSRRAIGSESRARLTCTESIGVSC
jgi:hypothetical protein